LQQVIIAAAQILLAAKEPKQVASNAFLKLCRLDVNDEIEKWARSGRITARKGFDGTPSLNAFPCT
jgi:hypothetical protein